MNKGFGANEVYDFIISDGEKDIVTIESVKANRFGRKGGLNYLKIKDALINPDFMEIILKGELDGKRLTISGITKIRDLNGVDKTKVISIEGALFESFEYDYDMDKEVKIEYKFEFYTNVKVVVA